MGKKKTTFGRPPKKAAEKQHIRIVIKVNEAESSLLRAAAVGKLSTWARETLLREAGRK